MHQGLWKYLGMNSRLMLQSQSPNANVSRVGIIKGEGNLETVGMNFWNVIQSALDTKYCSNTENSNFQVVIFGIDNCEI